MSPEAVMHTIATLSGARAFRPMAEAANDTFAPRPAEPTGRRLLAHLRAKLRAGDLRAAWVSSIVMLPQAVAFAVIAGLPPEMGIYASVVPVMVAALLGASTRLLSGPNTAVSVMVGAALLPLAAPGSSDYLALAAALTVLVGVMQLLAAACGAGRLLGLLPPFVCNGLTAGIGIVMISSQLAPAAGMLPVADSSPWLAVWSAGLNAGAANPCAIALSATTVPLKTFDQT